MSAGEAGQAGSSGSNGDLGGTGPGGSSGVGPGGSGAAPPPGTKGRGFTAKQIFVGFATQKDAQGAAGQLGVGGLEYGDQEAIAKAIVNDVNARGGVAGRKLVPVFHDFRTSQMMQNPSGAAQEACAHWTEDRPVFAVVSYTLNIDTLFSCLAKRQTPLILADVGGFRSAAGMARYRGYLYHPSAPTADRLVPAWLQRSAALDYFTGWNTETGSPGPAPVKVGLLYTNDPTFGGPGFLAIAEKELARQGRSVAARFEHSGEVAKWSSEMSGAVLRFRQAGVTHVVSQSATVLFFMQAAQSQGYRPRYTVSSPHGNILLQGTVPAQLKGAVGAGYLPTVDVDNGQDPGDVSGAQTRCENVMKKARQDTSKRVTLSLMLLSCDAFNFLVSAVRKGGLSPAGLYAGARQIGAMEPAATFGISFPGGRQDGANKLRDIIFQDDAFRYTNRTNHPM